MEAAATYATQPCCIGSSTQAELANIRTIRTRPGRGVRKRDGAGTVDGADEKSSGSGDPDGTGTSPVVGVRARPVGMRIDPARVSRLSIDTHNWEPRSYCQRQHY